MKTILAIVLFAAIVSTLCGCATFTPYGAIVVGTDAKKLEITGDPTTRTYTVKIEDLNQSTGLNVAGTTLTETTKIKVFGQVGEALIGEGGQVASQLIN